MNNRSAVVLLCIGLCGVLFADTIPGGDVSGVWYAAHSPYYINGSITIPAGDTLAIEPGVVVKFLGSYGLRAIGLLRAVGTASDSICFSRQDTVNTWGKIILEGDLTYTLSYCSFSRATGAIETELDRYNQNLIISNCSFRSNTQAVCVQAMWVNGELNVTDCYFGYNGPANNGGAISLGALWTWFSGKIEITGCVFEHNTATDNGGAISVHLLADEGCVSYVSIRDCEFLENAADSNGGAIGCQDMENDSATVIKNCTFIRNRIDYGNWIWNGGGALGMNSGDFRISHCCFIENQSLGWESRSIFAGDSLSTSHYDLDHCTIWGVLGYGDEVFVAGLISPSSMQVRNCIFTHCQVALYLYQSTSVSVNYSDFYGNVTNVNNPPAGFGVLDRVNYNGDSCDCYYDIFKYPAYVDTLNHDFHLTGGSPCIDAGNPAYANDPDGTRTDQGCYWFNQIGIEDRPVARSQSYFGYPGATVFAGPLQLPKWTKCRVFDVMGRTVDPGRISPGIYFIEIDGEVAQKVVKIK